MENFVDAILMTYFRCRNLYDVIKRLTFWISTVWQSILKNH